MDVRGDSKEPLIMDYLEPASREASSERMRVLKVEKSELQVDQDETEPGIKLTYMQVEGDNIQFDTSITINEGEFIAMQALAQYILPHLLGWSVLDHPQFVEEDIRRSSGSGMHNTVPFANERI